MQSRVKRPTPVAFRSRRVVPRPSAPEVALLTINARVEMPPEWLRGIVTAEIAGAVGMNVDKIRGEDVARSGGAPESGEG